MTYNKVQQNKLLLKSGEQINKINRYLQIVRIYMRRVRTYNKTEHKELIIIAAVV